MGVNNGRRAIKGRPGAATIRSMRSTPPRPNRAFFWATSVALTLSGLAAASAALAQQQNPLPPFAGAPAVDDSPGPLLRNWRTATDLNAWHNGPGHWRLALSPFSLHFSNNPEHRYVWAIGMERQRPDNWLAGASYFSNSFGQPSAYVYLGKRFPALLNTPQLFGQVSAGVLYGYKGAYKDKVPLNFNGFSPGLLVSAGWQFTPRVSATAHMLGTAGLMVQLAYELN